MTPEIRDIWTRMPEEAKERVRVNSGPMFPAEVLIALWGAVDAFETALAAGERWALRSEAERLRRLRGDVDEQEQDRLDELMCARCVSGDYGRETQEAVQEVIESGRFGDRRATLRAARQAAWMVRNGGGARREARTA